MMMYPMRKIGNHGKKKTGIIELPLFKDRGILPNKDEADPLHIITNFRIIDLRPSLS
jgi:hypothetical protein